MKGISTHVLDLSRGRPVEGIPVRLERLATGDRWKSVGTGTTNADGRISNLFVEGEALEKGTYRLVFDTRAYLSGVSKTPFYSQIPIVFDVADPAQHHHIPLLLSPFGYSTYRGS